MAKARKCFALSVAVAAALSVAPVQFNASADNPIVQTMYTADGAPMVWNDTFYMFTGHDEGNSGFYSMNDWRCFSTTDMKNWTDLGSPLAYTDFSWAKGEAWAAQVVERNGKFYYYVTVTAKSGGRAIGVAVADKPEGPYKDAIGKPLVGPMEGMKCIDPTAFIDDDGQAYLYFGNGELRYVLLNSDMVSCKSEPEMVNTKNGTFGAAFDEAPYLYKRNDLYYMIYASDWLPQKVSYSVSDSPTGPWKFGKVIMQHEGGNCGTNHPGIADYKGKTYLTYHDGNLPGGGDFARSECVDEIVWNSDGSMQEVKRTKNGPAQIESLDPFHRIEAETICVASGVKTEKCSAGGMKVCDINNGEYIKVAGVDFGDGANSFTVSASSAGSGGKLQIRLDKQDGTVIGSCDISGTGSWQNWEEFTCDISGAEGLHDLYFTFSGGSGALFNMDWWKFKASDVDTDRLISSIKVNDTENAIDWSLQHNFQVGDIVYGDRDITAVSVPDSVTGAEYIRTACDSKMFTEQLAKFSAGSDIAVYAAVDTRVMNRLDWLKEWTDTESAVMTSNNVQLELFRKTAKFGEVVTLGTNGGEGESANYIVFAVPLEKDSYVETIYGDANCDGEVNMADGVAIMQSVSSPDVFNLSEQGMRNADVFNRGDGVTNKDALSIQKYRLGLLNTLPESVMEVVTTTTTTMTTTTTVTAVKPSDFKYDSALTYKAAPDSYRKDCVLKGKVEKITYKTTVYNNNIEKSAYVYLPYGYDSSKQYDIMYMMHGGGGNESSIFIESDVMKKYLDSMIMNGDIEPMIVVTPTFNNAAGSDMTANAKNFWNELAKDVVPAVESRYSTYAKTASVADLKASRSHRAFSGFSMGSLAAWYVFLNDLDYFQYVMPLSGDCWAGSTAEEKAASVANAAKKSGYAKDKYFLMCATGTKDIAYNAMNDQINSMKKLTDTFTYTSDFSKGNLYFLLCDGGSHWWDGYIVNYIYDALPYLFHE